MVDITSSQDLWNTYSLSGFKYRVSGITYLSFFYDTTNNFSRSVREDFIFEYNQNVYDDINLEILSRVESLVLKPTNKFWTTRKAVSLYIPSDVLKRKKKYTTKFIPHCFICTYFIVTKWRQVIFTRKSYLLQLYLCIRAYRNLRQIIT